MIDSVNWDDARAKVQRQLHDAEHQRLVQTAREAERDARQHPHRWTDHIRLRILRRLNPSEWMIPRALRRRNAM